MALAGSAIVRFQGDYSGLAAGAAAASTAAGAKATSGFEGGWKKALRNSSIVKAAGKTGVLVGGAFAAATAITGFKRFKAFEEAETALGALGKTAEESKKLLADMDGVVKGTRYGLDEAASAMVGFVSGGIGLERIPGIMGDVADAAAVSGSDLNEVAGIFQKVKSQGKLTGETIQQLAKHNIPAIQILSSAYKMTGEELTKFISEGGVSSADFFKKWHEGAAGYEDDTGKIVSILGFAKEAGTDTEPAFKNMLAALGRLGEELLNPVFEQMSGWFESAADGLDGMGDAIKPFKKWLADFTRPLMDFMQENPGPFFAALGVVIAGAFVLMTIAAYNFFAAFGLITGIVLAVVAILAVVVGAVTYAYQNFEWFADGVDAAWQGIQVAAQFAWFSVLKPVFEALWGFITNTLIPVFQSIWETVKTVFAGIQAAISFAWNNVISPIFTAIKFYIFNILMPVFEAYLAVVQFVFSLIWAAIQDAWSIIRPIFAAVAGAVRDDLVPKFNAFKDVAVVVFTAVRGAVSSAWDFIKPIFEAIVRFVENELAPVWETISSAVTTAFEAIPNTIRGALRTAGNIVSAFMRAAGGIADAIGLDKIAGALRSGAASADSWGEGGGGKSRPGYQAPRGGMAAGGFISGGIAGKDSVPAMLMPGEVVIRKSSVDKFGARNLLDVNEGRMPFANGGMVPGYGLGGFIGDAWDATGGKVVTGVASVLGSVIDVARSVVAGAVEKAWPKMGVPDGLMGFPAGGLNYARSGIIDLIRGHAQKTVDAEDAKETGKQGASGLAGSTTGLDPEFLRRFNQWNSATGNKYGIGAGFRSYARQVYFWNKYLNGTGNLAARPGTSNHGRGLAIDTSPRVSAADQALARQFRLHFPVRGEPWHIEPFGQGGVVKHRKSFDSGGTLEPGWNMVRNDTGADEHLRPTGQAPLIGEAHFHDGVDLDLVTQKLTQRVLAGSL